MTIIHLKSTLEDCGVEMVVKQGVDGEKNGGSQPERKKKP